VCLVDVDAERAGLATRLGCAFAAPQDAPGEADVVIHASASDAGLATALSLLRDPALDALITGETAFDDLASAYGAILADPGTLCHRVRYEPR